MSFTAIITKFRKCKECAEVDDGIYAKMDCGCVWEEEVGTYPTVNAARLAAMAKASKKGTFGNPSGRAEGSWRVETEQDGTVEWGCHKKIDKNPMRQAGTTVDGAMMPLG